MFRVHERLLLHEKQADVFAAYLLMPEPEFEKLAGDNLTTYELAEQFDVLPYFAKFRIGLANIAIRKNIVICGGSDLHQKEVITPKMW